MAVVTKYGSGAYNASSASASRIDAALANGHVHRLFSTVEIANGDSATSIVYFGSLPTGVRLCGMSIIRNDAITGLTDFDLGTAADPDCLVDGASLAVAGTVSAVGIIDIAALGDPLWDQQAGVTADPGGRLDIIGTLNAAATAAGTITLELYYTTK